MAIDESRIESVQSGAEEGAGVRVVDGGTTYFAHVDGLDPADLERAADEAASALRGERGEPRPLRAVAHAPQPIEHPPRTTSRQSARRRSCASSTSAAAAQGAEVAPGPRLLRRGASRGHRRQLRGAASAGDDRTRTRIGVQAVARRGERSRPAPRRSAATAASSCSKTTRARSRRRPRARR